MIEGPYQGTVTDYRRKERLKISFSEPIPEVIYEDEFGRKFKGKNITDITISLDHLKQCSVGANAYKNVQDIPIGTQFLIPESEICRVIKKKVEGNAGSSTFTESSIARSLEEMAAQ